MFETVIGGKINFDREVEGSIYFDFCHSVGAACPPIVQL